MFIICQLFCCSMFKYFTVNQQVSPVTDRKCFVHIVIGNKDANIFKFHFGHNGLNILHRNRIYTGKGFIQ